MKSILASVLVFILIISLLFAQVQWAYGEEGESPITAAITSAIISPITSPITSAIAAVTASANKPGANGPATFAPKKCEEAKPGNKPVLLAVASGSNEVTLTWTKAGDPVSYYLVSYGMAPGLQQYGNPNAGDKNTTSFKVKNLSGGITYYFKVRAGNGCMPGEFSNEIGVKVEGQKTVGPAEGFSSFVLATSKSYSTSSGAINTASEAAVNNNPSSRIFNSALGTWEKIVKFVERLVSR